jgi:hypothetical protein
LVRWHTTYRSNLDYCDISWYISVGVIYHVASGAVILSRRPESWDQFFKLRAETAETGGTEEFMKVREDEAPQKRNLF